MTISARRAAALVAVAMAGALAGCSANPGTAAVVDGRSIGQAEVAQTYQDLAPLLADAQPKTVVQALIIAPDIIAAAEANGVGVSADQGLALLQQVSEQSGVTPPDGYGEGAITIARSELAGQNLSNLADGDAIMAQVTATIAARDVEVNPQYGAFSADSLSVEPIAWPWIATSAAG